MIPAFAGMTVPERRYGGDGRGPSPLRVSRTRSFAAARLRTIIQATPELSLFRILRVFCFIALTKLSHRLALKGRLGFWLGLAVRVL